MDTQFIEIPVADLLPHQPPMVLVDKVICYRENFIHTRLSIHKDVPFFAQQGVPAYIAIEYMAQTVGVWNGLMRRQQDQEAAIGFLLGTRKLTLEVPTFLEGATLDIYGCPKYSDGEIACFECWVEIDNQRVAHAILNVFQPQNGSDFLAQQ